MRAITKLLGEEMTAEVGFYWGKSMKGGGGCTAPQTVVMETTYNNATVRQI